LGNAFHEVRRVWSSGGGTEHPDPFGVNSSDTAWRYAASGRPATLALVFQEGAQWYGARHRTVGVDQQSLKARPSVAAEVTEFVSAIGSLPGAKRPPSQLDAYTFAPHDAPEAIPGIMAAFENLIEHVQGST
jgi:hypothetical protein